MGYDGTFHAAVRGPAGVLRTLPEVLSDWRKTEGKTWIAPGLENETECFLKALERAAKAAESMFRRRLLCGAGTTAGFP